MARLDLPGDYEDLLRELLEQEAEFVLVGGWAVAVHGYGRATDDMDIFVRPTPDNAAKVYAALEHYGAPLKSHQVTKDLFSREQYGYRMGRRPLMIEILTTIDGVTYDEAARDALTVEVDDLQVPVIGREALLTNKRASGRPKDVADLEGLESE